LHYATTLTIKSK